MDGTDDTHDPEPLNELPTPGLGAGVATPNSPAGTVQNRTESDKGLTGPAAPFDLWTHDAVHAFALATHLDDGGREGPLG